MPKTVTKIEHSPKLQSKKKVAAYARVSSGKDAMLHSLSAQVSYYNALIQKEDDWQFAGVYADEAITGTKEERGEFQRMLSDCRAGKIDLIITKSISRFARNTVTLLETVRMLKAMGVDVFFEEQNIHTMSSDGELMLTILASYAQEESRSVSENQKWRVRKNFEEGIPWNGAMIGYRLNGDHYEVVADEAEVVQRIFADYLSGSGYQAIATALNEDGILTRYGGKWNQSAVWRILRNPTYTGNLVLQRTYSENHITKRILPNNGQLPKYLVEDAHEAIIDLATFQAVQEEIESRAKRYCSKGAKKKTYPYSGLIECANCGKKYRRKTTATRVVWICATFNTLGKKHCASKQIPEETLNLHTSLVTDDIEDVEKIIVAENNTLHYHMKDGNVITRQWDDRSRAESWTPELREKARQRETERRKRNGEGN